MEMDDEIDDLIAHGFEPKEWMTKTERVIDVYKNEVDDLRKKMRLFEIDFASAMKTMKEIKKLQAKASLYLEEFKETK